jgi:hypothetical protein
VIVSTQLSKFFQTLRTRVEWLGVFLKLNHFYEFQVPLGFYTSKLSLPFGRELLY